MTAPMIPDADIIDGLKLIRDNFAVEGGDGGDERRREIMNVAIERLSASPTATPLTRRDDLHNVIARIMQQPVYNSSEICDAVEQYLERLSASPTAPKGEA